MIRISERSRKELFMQQLDIQDQLEDYEELSEGDINSALIDDSLAHFCCLLLDSDNDNEDEMLNILLYTKAKYRKMKDALKKIKR